MQISCQIFVPGPPSPRGCCAAVTLGCSGMDVCSQLHVFYKGANVISKETTLVMYSKAKYFIQYCSNVMYCLLDTFCFLLEVWDLGLFAGLDSCILSGASCAFFHKVLNFFLSLKMVRATKLQFLEKR